MSDTSSIRDCLRVVTEGLDRPEADAAQVEAIERVVARACESWGVWSGVRRRIARHLAHRELDRDWWEYTIESLRDRVQRGEVRNPGALLVRYCQIELTRRGLSWRAVDQKQRSVS